MADHRYLVVDHDGRVVNIVVGYINVPDLGFVHQHDGLMHIGIGWIYDSDADDFVAPDNARAL